jgi:hypothetical protein
MAMQDLNSFIGLLCQVIIMLRDSISVSAVHYFNVYTVSNCTTAVLLIRFEIIVSYVSEWRTNLVVQENTCEI